MGLLSHLFNPGDSELQIYRKKLILVTCLFSVATAGLSLPLSPNLVIASLYSTVTCFNLGTLLYVGFVKAAPDLVTELLVLVMVPLVCFYDYHNILRNSERTWPLLILFVDYLLVLQCRPYATIMLVSFACFWIVLNGFEVWLRFGFYDLDIGPSYEERRADVCGCDHLPCSKPVTQASFSAVFQIAVFLLDFYFTRGFATKALSEQRKVEAAIATTHEVAQCMADFDLDTAALRLHNENNIPDELKCVLFSLVGNLRNYRPYLPMSCFVNSEEADRSSDQDRSPCNKLSRRNTAVSSNGESSTSEHLVVNFKRLELRRSCVTMSLISFQMSQEDKVRYQARHGEVVEEVVRVATECRGILDTFVGNKLILSFNAAQTCSQHALSCMKCTVLCLLAVGEGTTAAVYGGVVHCGDLGTATMRKFSIIGDLPNLGCAMERVCRKMGFRLLCNDLVRKEVEHVYQTLLILQEWLLKNESTSEDTQVFLYSVTPAVPKEAEETEWMYQIDEVTKKYEQYNMIGKRYLLGHTGLEMKEAETPDEKHLRTCLEDKWAVFTGSFLRCILNVMFLKYNTVLLTGEMMACKRLESLWRYLIRPDDSSIQIIRKKLLGWATIITVIVCCVGMISYRNMVLTLMSLWGLASATIILSVLLITKRAPDYLVEFSALTFIVPTLVTDYYSVIEGTTRGWPAFVVLIDCLLLMKGRQYAIKVVAITACLWLFFLCIEDMLRFGFYDLSFTTSHETRKTDLCDCDHLPCKKSASIAIENYGLQMCVFLFDFYLTKRFSRKALSEQRKVEAAIATTHEVAQCMADFDLDTAALRLHNENNIPDELKCVLFSLVGNLRNYRPYLPMSCFVNSDESSRSSDNMILSRRKSPENSIFESSTKSTSERFIMASSKMSELRKSCVTMSLISFKLSQEDKVRYQARHGEVVEEVVRVATECRGILDTFVGNKLILSFNAAQTCSQHALSCMKCTVLCLLAVGEGTTAAVYGGVVHCGDLGTATMRKFSIIGDLPNLGCAMERVCRKMGFRLLCNDLVRKEVEHVYQTLLILQEWLLKNESTSEDTQVFLYSVTPAVPKEAEETEWMYQIDEVTKKYEQYNMIGKRYLLGHTGLEMKEAETPDEKHLRTCLEDKVPPPSVRTLCY